MKITEFDIENYRQQAKAAITANDVPTMAKLRESYGKRHVHLETHGDYSRYQYQESDYVTLTSALQEQIEIIYFNGCKNGNAPEIPVFVKIDFTEAEVNEVLRFFDEEY